MKNHEYNANVTKKYLLPDWPKMESRYFITVWCRKFCMMHPSIFFYALTGNCMKESTFVAVVPETQACFGRKMRKGISVMFERAINEYWILYVMMGICAIGVISRLWLAGIYSGLLKDVQYAKEPKKKLIRQIKERYETCYQLNEGINNIEAFLVRNLYGYRFMGITLGGIQKISGQAFFLCLLSGCVIAGYAYANGMPLELVGVYSASAVAMATFLIYINCIFDVQGRQIVLEAGIVDYLQNYLSALLDKQKDGKEQTDIALAEEVQEEKEEKETFQAERKEGRATEKRASVFRRKEQKYKPEEENTSAKEQAERLLVELRKNPRGGKELSPELQGEIDSLRNTLNQIAVGLEKGQNGENRQLAEEEIRIVEEILGEYLA